MDATRASCTSGTISLRTRLGFVVRLLASCVELRTGLPSSSAWPSRSMAFSALENLTSSMLVPLTSALAPGGVRRPHISNSYSCISAERYVLFIHADYEHPAAPKRPVARLPHRPGCRQGPQR